MIVETIISDRLVKHESDQGVMIKQVETDILYSNAVDVIPCQYTYVETDEPITDEPITDAEALRLIMEGER